MDLSRVAMVIGKDKLPVLGQARIAVVGLGGVGSYVAESLCRSGGGHLLLIDADKVAASNINRQLPALTSTFGRFKTEVVRQRLLDINPDCEIETVSKFYEPGAFAEFFSGSFTFIADAIDSTPSKVDLLLECVQRDIPVISSMGTGNKLDPTAFEVADIYKTSVCPLAKVMRRELKKRGIKKLKVVYSQEKPVTPIDDMAISCKSHCICPPGTARKCTQRRQVPGSNAFVPSVVGLIIAGEVVKDLIR